MSTDRPSGAPRHEREHLVDSHFHLNQHGPEPGQNRAHDAHHLFRLHRFIGKTPSPLVRHGVHPLHNPFDLGHHLSEGRGLFCMLARAFSS